MKFSNATKRRSLVGLSALAFLTVIVNSGCAPELPEPVACGGDIRNLHLYDPNAVATDVHWARWGYDYENTHHAANETMISPANVDQLEVKWDIQTTGSVSTNPTVVGDTLYFPDWGPNDYQALLAPGYVGSSLYSLNRWSGQVNWSKTMRQFNDNDFGNISRSSPAVDGDLIIVGDMQGQITLGVLSNLFEQTQRLIYGWDEICSGYIHAINRHTGDLVWRTRLAENEFDMISQSPTIYDGKIYVGVSTNESAYVRNATVPCCEFRGNVVALDLHTGDIVWRKHMTYDGFGSYDHFSGASVWGGTPTIDIARNALYVPTGQNYKVPASHTSCIQAAGNDLAAQAVCAADWQENYFDSLVALDLTTGDVKWAMRSRPYDAWNAACISNNSLPSDPLNCPDPEGYDADFGQPPMLHTVQVNGQPEDRLAAGTKGGEVFSLRPGDGSIAWSRQVGPGGSAGGMEFGSATDGQRIYVQNSNSNHVPYVLEAGPDAGKTINSGFWAALDAASGALLWQTQVPGGDLPLTGSILSLAWGANLGLGYFKKPMGPITVANGVVYTGVADYEGTMVAMDAATGAILWQFQAGASLGSAPSIVDGRMYWGVGYKYGLEGNHLYSFGLSSDTRTQ